MKYTKEKIFIEATTPFIPNEEAQYKFKNIPKIAVINLTLNITNAFISDISLRESIWPTANKPPAVIIHGSKYETF